MIGRTFLLVCSLSAILLFSGCGKNNDVFVLQQFESEVVITTTDTQYKGTVNFNGIDSIKLSLTYPENMNNIQAVSNSESTEFFLDDIRCNASDDNPVNELRCILADMKNKTVNINAVNKFSCNNINYEVTVEKGESTKLKVQTDDCTFSFCV